MERILTEYKEEARPKWIVSDQLYRYQRLHDRIIERTDYYEQIREKELEMDQLRQEWYRQREEAETLDYYDEQIHGTEELI